MTKIVQGLKLSVFLLIFTISFSTAFAAQTNETGLIASGQDTRALSVTENNYLIEKSTYHRFFTRAKDNLNLFGQQLTFVFSNYSQAPSEIVNALNHLTGGKGMGHLIKISLLFLLLIAIGFGVEKIINIPLKKYKQQLQSTVPKSFIQSI